MSSIYIEPNAKLINILSDVYKKIKNFTINQVVLLPNKTIFEFSSSFLLKPDKGKKRVFISDGSFFDNKIVWTLKINSKEWAGNFLSLFEKYSIIACRITTPKANIHEIEEIKNKYQDFFFEKISQETSFVDYKKFSVPISLKNTESLLYRLGTYCYLKRDSLDNLYKSLINLDKNIIKKLREKNDVSTIDNLLVISSILKYHIYRLYEKSSEKENFYKKIMKDIHKDIEKGGRTQRDFIKLKHNAYLKALIDGECYNLEKGKEVVKEHSSRAAMAAIATRNLSHNIGSHVLSFLIQKIEEKIQKLVTINDSGLDDSEDWVINKNLYQYMQHRMDFLAEVTTSDPVWEMSMNFEQDILNGFCNQKIILDYICKSEGKVLQPSSFLRKIDKGCEHVSIPNGVIGKHAFYSILENLIRNAAKHYRDTSIELPFLIELKVPNRLLLSSKVEIPISLQHKCEWIEDKKYLSFKTSEENFVLLTEEDINNGITFYNLEDKAKVYNFHDIQKDYIELRIWDNRPGSCGSFEVENDKGEIRKQSIVEKLSGFINSEFIDDDGRIKTGGWGLKEMRIAANFLRKNNSKDVIKKENKDIIIQPPLVEVLCGDPNNNLYSCCNENPVCQHSKDYTNRLGFRFYLRRPKDLLVVAQDTDIPNKSNFEIEIRKEEEVFEIQKKLGQ